MPLLPGDALTLLWCVPVALLAWAVVRFDLWNAARLVLGFVREGTPPRVHLVPIPKPGWRNAPRAAAIVADLLEASFRQGGSFTARQIPGLRLQAWFQSHEGATALIYELPLMGVVLDFVTRYEDGESVTYTTTKQGTGLEDPPGQRKVRLPGARAMDLYRLMLRERPSKATLRTLPQEFAGLFERAYADEMDWRNARGGPTEDEIRAMARAEGRQVTDEVVAMTRKSELDRAMRAQNVAVRERLLEERVLTTRELEGQAGQLFLIHDDIPPAVLLELYHRLAGPTAPEPVLPPPWVSARQAFLQWSEALPEERRFRKLGQTARPVASDAYCAPPPESG